MKTLRIGALAERTRTNPPTIRYYEEIGLLHPADRRSGGQRIYSDDDVRRLTFIRRCRALGFAIEEVRWLVELVDDGARSCTDARDIVGAQLAAVREKQRELRRLERRLASLVREGDSCSGGPAIDCAIVADLSTPRAHGQE